MNSYLEDKLFVDNAVLVLDNERRDSVPKESGEFLHSRRLRLERSRDLE